MPSTRVRFVLTALLTGLALLFASASALNPIRIDCGEMPYDDGEEDGVLQAVEEVGVDLALDEDGLILVFVEEDMGALGNAVVPSYDPEALPEDALERVVARRFLCRVCLAKAVPDGLTVLIDDAPRAEVETATLARLEAIGCTVGEAFADHGYSLRCADQDLRVVFATREDSTQIYLGY